MACVSSDNMTQMRLNIRQHRQKLFKCLQNVDDNVLKLKIKNIILNDINKSNMKHDVKQKTASSTKLLKSKIKPINTITNHQTRSTTQIKLSKPGITIKKKNFEVLTNADIQNHKSVKVPKELPVSSTEVKLIPVPNIEIKDPEPLPVFKKLKEILLNELDNSSSSSDESDNISIENDNDYISVGNNDDSNDIFQQNDENDGSKSIKVVKYSKHEQPVNNDIKKKDSIYISSDDSDIYCPTTSKRSRIIKKVPKFRSKNNITKSKFRDSLNSLDSINISSDDSDIYCPTTSKRSQIIKKVPKFRSKNNITKSKFRDSLKVFKQNVQERARRKLIAEQFDILSKTCSYLNSTKRVASKVSILLAAKKECDLLICFEKKLLMKKKLLRKINDTLFDKLNNINKDYEGKKIANV